MTGITASPAGDTSSCALSEQARAAARQLLRWKDDADQDGYLLLKSVFVLTGTDSVSSRAPGRPGRPHCAQGGLSSGRGGLRGVFLPMKLISCSSSRTPLLI